MELRQRSCIQYAPPAVVVQSKGIRGDGNFKIAKRICSRGWWRRTRLFTVILALCGLDGSLLQPMRAYPRECWSLISRDLEGMLVDIRDFGVEDGLTLEQALSVFHSTDTYLKHRKKIRRS